MIMVRRTKYLRPVLQYAKVVLPDWGTSNGLGYFLGQVAILSIKFEEVVDLNKNKK